MKEYYIKEYYKTGVCSTSKEKEEAKYLNIYANIYAKYVDNNEDHVYRHIENNLLDVASVSKLKERISILKKRNSSTSFHVKKGYR